MTDQTSSPSRPPTREEQQLRDELLRQGYSAEEADIALRDAGILAPGAAVPGPAVPGSATPGPGAPGYGHPGHGDPTATGRTSYLVGLLAWLPIPVVSAVIAGIAMAAVYPGQRRRSALAAENARRAANWGLTYALGVVLSVALTVAVVAATQPETPDPDATPWQVLFLTPVLVLGVAHLVVTVLGLTRTARGQVYAPRAIPFFRAAEPRS
ncbi:DUF4870 domain-containing protein [Cellulomonas cellasea]|uniref:Putative Tic20 family protein n=1 Tax=Cellulomonas cellasea TaxID=43670 RepID=A0A7W4UJF1_9CELL|nr:DUF4870 domain-containing protein [Cellulomonas cellasea]MBB2925292.1 putative Tic20 family protein [Cellulomonas cellasea]